jgi:predicted cobalt transporter CbtA
MTRILLVRGMLAGVVAGLLVFALARWVGEPQVERAIAFETNMDRAMGGASEPEVVSREVQRNLGLLTGTVVYGTVLAVQVERRFHDHLGGWNASLLAVVIFVIATALISHFLPEFDEVPAGFPVTLMWKFRVAAIEMQVLMWSVLGFLFGWFADRDLAAQRLHS